MTIITKKQVALLALVALSLTALLLTLPADAKRGDKALYEKLPEKYKKWLESVQYIIAPEEESAFLQLDKDYERDAFIERFWQVRDPYPNTAKNEFKDRWDRRLQDVMSLFGTLKDDRARMLLLNGQPTGSLAIRCGPEIRAMDIWFYDGSEKTNQEFFLVFYEIMRGREYRLWQPLDGLRAFFHNARMGVADYELVEVLTRSCFESDTLLNALANISQQGNMGYSMLLAKLESPPQEPDQEWLGTFSSYSTNVEEGTETFTAKLGFEFPGRHQNRTIVEGFVEVDKERVGRIEVGGASSYDLLLTGEVLRADKLFDRFRYKFHLLPDQVTGSVLPVAFQRYLRPGPYQVVLKLEDLSTGRACRLQEELEVPGVTDDDVLVVLPPELVEAEEILSAWEATIRIVPPRQEMQVGKLRIDTLTTGTGIAKVKFALDGKPVLAKSRPPFSVELDLGKLPRSQLLEATALDAEGEILDRDELLLNSSAHRFAIRLIEPRPDKSYGDRVRVAADVEVPEGKTLDRVEIYVEDHLAATLYQPPFDQMVELPNPGAMAYVRVVAYLPDDNFTEDYAFVNSPHGLEEIDVQFVELYTTVLDKADRPVQGLTAEDFQVWEDQQPQSIVRFEVVEDLPIHAAILLDTSASMEESMELSQAAALHFFQKTLQPQDRAALITFSDRPQMAVKFTNDVLRLAGGLAGLKAERGTAIYDSLIYSLFYFNGVTGQRALLVLSDGKDETSRFEFKEALEFARRAGVTIYTIGLEISRTDFDTRRHLSNLAEQTGGSSFFIKAVEELPGIYDRIEEELRSQYLIAYQSANTAPSDQFRVVDVDVNTSGMEARTIRGYFP